MTSPPSLDHLAALTVLSGRTWHAEPLVHGRVEPVVRVTTTDDVAPPLDLVVRRVGPARGVDLDDEGPATVAAAALGVGPAVVEWRPEDRLLAVEHVTGRMVTRSDLLQPEPLARLCTALRRLHAAPEPFGQDLDLFAEARRHPALVGDRLLAELESALGAHPEGSAPCHNDVVPGNFLDDGERIWLVDFEYAGNIAPSAELACLVVGAELGTADIPTIAAAYDGEATPLRVARIALWRVVQLVLWSEWARAVASKSWADRLSAARDEAVADPALRSWLDEVRRG
ncbi:MAG: phosphotransferase [Nocardioidaceae bacterium]|nr:phosphotransferase [Nocardioidaceae bacterium]MCL2612163.1 phosphotransferase [Nocardioidaceae bacterium]